MREIKRKSSKQGGFVLTSELVLIVTIMVMGMTVGLVTMRDALTAEMEDVAEAIGALDQSYAFNGMMNAESSASIDGSSWGDSQDIQSGDTAEFVFVEAGPEGSLWAPSAGSASSANTGNAVVGTVASGP